MILSDSLEPKEVFKYFEEICAIPHGSGNTEAIRQYLCDFAGKHDLDHVTDAVGNVIIYKSAAPGHEEALAVTLQGHMDMVAVCTPDSGIDMTTHKLELQINRDYLSARDTSLGGDDGIAVAMMLAVLASDELEHPAIEALFTMDEETGMDGARGLDTSLLQGRRLINIDSEEEGYVYVGCAGGARVYLDLPIERKEVNITSEPNTDLVRIKDEIGITQNNQSVQPHQSVDIIPQLRIFRIDISGCAGGHSGSEIHRGRANANILTGRVLYELLHHNMTNDTNSLSNTDTTSNFTIHSDFDEIQEGSSDGHKDTRSVPDAISFISFDGGHVDNAIPISATLIISAAERPSTFDRISKEITDEFKTTDPEMTITIRELTGEETDDLPQPATAQSTSRLADLLISLPNGVQSMSADIEGLVETSLNLGVVQTVDDHVTLQFSVRSSVESAKRSLIDRLTALASLSGASTEVNGSYPGWQYRPDSPLRDHMVRIYREMRDREPVIKAIHAGLECGFFVSAIEGLDCVSIGPEMHDVHTVNEHLSISSTARTWEYLLRVLATM